MKTFLWVLIPILGIMVGCSTKDGNVKSESKCYVRPISEDSSRKKNIESNFYSLPSPMELANAIQQTGIEYNPSILHTTEMVGRYSTNMAMALNLGIYSADLSYCIYFGQQQVAMKYVGGIKSLASNLDISNCLDDSKLRTIEDNIQNKEMLKKIVSETFFGSDAFLKESNRSETAAMITLGMWIESVYIATNICADNPDNNKSLYQCIEDQKFVLETISGLLDSHAGVSDIDSLSVGLKPLKESFKPFDAEFKSLVAKDDLQNVFSQIDSLRTSYTHLF